MDPMTPNHDAASEAGESPETMAAEGHDAAGGEGGEMHFPAPEKPLKPKLILDIDQAMRALLMAILSPPGAIPPIVDVEALNAAPRWTEPFPMKLGALVVALGQVVQQVGTPQQKRRFQFGPDEFGSDGGLRVILTTLKMAAKDKKLVAALGEPLRALASKGAGPKPPPPGPGREPMPGPSPTMAGRGEGAPMPAPEAPRPSGMVAPRGRPGASPSVPPSMLRAAR